MSVQEIRYGSVRVELDDITAAKVAHLDRNNNGAIDPVDFSEQLQAIERADKDKVALFMDRFPRKFSDENRFSEKVAEVVRKVLSAAADVSTHRQMGYVLGRVVAESVVPKPQQGPASADAFTVADYHVPTEEDFATYQAYVDGIAEYFVLADRVSRADGSPAELAGQMYRTYFRLAGLNVTDVPDINAPACNAVWAIRYNERKVPFSLASAMRNTAEQFNRMSSGPFVVFPSQITEELRGSCTVEIFCFSASAYLQTPDGVVTFGELVDRLDAGGLEALPAIASYDEATGQVVYQQPTDVIIHETGVRALGQLAVRDAVSGELATLSVYNHPMLVERDTGLSWVHSDALVQDDILRGPFGERYVVESGLSVVSPYGGPVYNLSFGKPEGTTAPTYLVSSDALHWFVAHNAK